MGIQLKYCCDFLNGTAISTGNSETHELSTAAWHSCSTAAFAVMLSVWALHAACLGVFCIIIHLMLSSQENYV